MNPRTASNAPGNIRAFRALGYTLFFLMMAGGAMTVGNLIQNAAPGSHSGIIVAVLLLLVIERLYTHRQMKSLVPLSSEWAIAIGAQWIVLLLIARFLLAYADGLAAFRRELSLIGRGYIVNLFTPEFVFTLFLALLVWYLCSRFLGLLDEIGLDPELALQEDSAPIQYETVPAHQRLVNLIFSLGIVLVVMTALARLNLRSIVSHPSGLPSLELNQLSGGEAGALLYFIFGLALLSLSRLMSLQTHWNRLRIPISSRNLTRQWGVYSLCFLFILAVFVSLLPAGDSLGFVSVLRTLFGFLLEIIVFLSQLLLAIILVLFSLPFLLLGKAPLVTDGATPPPFPVLPPAGTQVPTTTNATWELIRSILLWGSLIAIILFALIQFVRQHGGLAAAVRNSRVANWLVLAWQWLYRNADTTRATLARAIADGWQGLVARLGGTKILPPSSWINLRSLDPRRQVYFFYLAVIRRGAEQGLARRPSQSPSEYGAQLEKSLPSATEDIDAITAAFMEARYSRREVEAEKANLVKAIWGRIRLAFQDKAKSEQSANK